MNEQLINEINGVRYVLIEVPCIEGKSKEFNAFVKKHEMVFQGVGQIDRGGWLSKGFVINKMLLPEKNFEAYSKDKI